MRYLFSTGLFGAVTTGISLLRGTREAPVTWRAVLAWVSWGVTFALAVGAAIDMRRDHHGEPVAIDSPLAAKQSKRAKKQLKAIEKAAKATKR
ncbi:hypothetical protein FM104_08165 [Microbacterium esteraromaticum]|uniref:NADH:ubiquinone oxidoreductase n=1 Tax=Microbacterium esteraromaticum TaxID=57043 RepID=A0A1R4JM63_9MICO|nr:hypothetical protein [Microbacterium esteraromaticum]SJN33089.1 hypothetical protein FM104_08165 [Microbacterium esteraromaticum]